MDVIDESLSIDHVISESSTELVKCNCELTYKEHISKLEREVVEAKEEIARLKQQLEESQDREAKLRERLEDISSECDKHQRLVVKDFC